MPATNQVNLLQSLKQGVDCSTAPADPSCSVAPGPGGLADYTQTAFSVFLGVAVALSVVMITWGGLEYILSKIPGAKTEGKDRIKNALWGLLLALVAWVILNTINTSISTATL